MIQSRSSQSSCCRASGEPTRQETGPLVMGVVDPTRGDVLKSGHPRPPSIVVGVTSPQTCVVLPGRLRALRRAGFRVFVVSGPGRLLEQTAVNEAVEAIAIPLKRGIAPFSDILS